jgi:capsular exopolysaccharide synthesis family protein
MNDSSEVKLHFLDYWRTIRLRAGLIALAFLLVMITAGVTVYFVPRQYFSKVTMEVKADNSGPLNNMFSGTGRTGLDPQFVTTQFQILQKTEILYQVIENLKLQQTWAPEGRSMPLQGIYAKLLRMMELREIRNTGLIEIGVYSTDAQEAANIANTIAVVYRQKRRSDLQKGISEALDQLRDEVDKQRKRVEEAAIEMTRLRERDEVIDPDPDNYGTSIGTSERNIGAIEAQLNESRLEVTKLKGQLEQIMKLKPEDLKEALRTLGNPDQTVEKMVTQLQDNEADQVRLFSAGLGDNHPRLVGLRAQKETFSKQLAEQLNTVRSNLATKLQYAEGVQGQLDARMETAKKQQIADKQKTAEYVEAKTRYLQAKRIFEAAQIQYSTKILEKGIDFDPAKIWEKAEAALYPAKPKVAAYMALAAMVGLVIGVGLAFFIEYLDTSVKTLEDVERYLQIPVLAVIPKDVSMLIKTKGDTADAEAYRILRANIEFNKPDGKANTLTLVSGGPGEGKSTTLNNLAFTCAKGGYNVLVVDADLRRPTQQGFFDVENNFGLTDYLIGKADLEEITRTTKIDNLSFIPSGQIPEGAVGILNSQRMVELIARVKGLYDLVFFDSPPILGVSDGSVLASEVDVTIMVVQHRRFPRAMLQRVKQAVEHAGGTLIGVVLNNVDTKHDEGYNYYNSYNDYYNPRRKEGGTPAVRETAATTSTVAATPARPRSTDREDY